MADYWKSQPRKFCQYCKCWIADNKPSVEFHERGKNHKENVAAKISEIKKKSIQKAKQEEKMSKHFAAMEEAALKAYEEDLKRMEMESQGRTYAPVQSTPQQHLEMRPDVKPQSKPQTKPQAQKVKKKPQKFNRKPRVPMETQIWVEGLAEDGQTYYYNTVTGESRWEKPAGLEGESSASAQPQQSSSAPEWMEAVSPEGYTYYYNTVTGESSWLKPGASPSNEASDTNKEEEEQKDEEESQEDPEPPQPELLSGGEGSSDGGPKEAPAPEETGNKPEVPEISFRKRKAESEPPEEEEEIIEDDVMKEEEKEVKTEKVQTTRAEPEKKREERPAVEIKIRKPRPANPYGSWKQIKQEVDPYATVDLQLPQVEESAAVPTELPPEPKPKFKERVITSLGEEGGPATFRRNKGSNSKSRSLRQRDDDD